jgi:hypothetical protein
VNQPGASAGKLAEVFFVYHRFAGQGRRVKDQGRMMGSGLLCAIIRRRSQTAVRSMEMRMRWLCKTLWAAGSTAVLLGIFIAVLLGTSSVGCFAQTMSNEPAASAGDQPSDPGPLATDLSPALHSKPIRAAMRKVADWELQRVQAQPPSRAWDFGTLDIGLMAAARTLHEPRYSQYVASVGDHFGWKLERTTDPANDFAIAQAFLEVYRSSHNEAQLAPLRRQFDDAVALLNDPEKPAWGWCDALFMAPPAGSELSNITGDPTYDAYVDREWGKTGKVLYDRQKHLFSRDAGSLNKREKNGEKFFWSRSNGLAMAGTLSCCARWRPRLPRRSRATGCGGQVCSMPRVIRCPRCRVRRSSLTPLRGASITACWMRRFTCQSLRKRGPGC